MITQRCEVEGGHGELRVELICTECAGNRRTSFESFGAGCWHEVVRLMRGALMVGWLWMFCGGRVL